MSVSARLTTVKLAPIQLLPRERLAILDSYEHHFRVSPAFTFAGKERVWRANGVEVRSHFTVEQTGDSNMELAVAVSAD